jgi:hypothetical protein
MPFSNPSSFDDSRWMWSSTYHPRKNMFSMHHSVSVKEKLMTTFSMVAYGNGSSTKALEAMILSRTWGYKTKRTRPMWTSLCQTRTKMMKMRMGEKAQKPCTLKRSIKGGQKSYNVDGDDDEYFEMLGQGHFDKCSLKIMKMKEEEQDEEA